MRGKKRREGEKREREGEEKGRGGEGRRNSRHPCVSNVFSLFFSFLSFFLLQHFIHTFLFFHALRCLLHRKIFASLLIWLFLFFHPSKLVVLHTPAAAELTVVVLGHRFSGSHPLQLSLIAIPFIALSLFFSFAASVSISKRTLIRNCS